MIYNDLKDFYSIRFNILNHTPHLNKATSTSILSYHLDLIINFFVEFIRRANFFQDSCQF